MNPEIVDVAVIGAGIAGMSAAAQLTQAGHKVTVFEKSRGPGGRTSTRRQDPLRFDHGAPFFGVQDERFAAQLQSWIDAGWVTHWHTQAGTWNQQNTLQVREVSPALAHPKMSALARAIGEGIHCHYATRIETLARQNDHWRLRCTQGQDFGAKRVLLTPPPPQSLALLADRAPAISTALAKVGVTPDWTVMLSGADTLLDEGLGWVDFPDHPTLGRLIAEHRKPERPVSAAWTLHASPRWSRQHEEQDPAWVADALTLALREVLGDKASFDTAKAHRWRYARTEHCLTQDFLQDKSAGLYYCGDACLGSDVEAAFLSATAAAQAICKL